MRKIKEKQKLKEIEVEVERVLTTKKSKKRVKNEQ